MLFGKVIDVQKNHCRIQVFCKVIEKDNKIKVLQTDVESIVGPTKRVFVPNNNWHTLNNNELVLFTVKNNEKESDRDDYDKFVLDEINKSQKAYPILCSTEKSIDAILEETFFKTNLPEGKSVYVLQKEKIIGRLKIKNEANYVSLTIADGKTFVHVWDKHDTSTCKVSDLESYIIGKPDKSIAERIDVSTPLQLSNWFQKKSKNVATGSF